MATTSQAIQQQINQLAQDLNNQIAIQNTYRGTGTRAIQGAYKGLGSQLGGLTKQVGTDVSAGRTQIGKDYGLSGQNIAGAEATVREMLGGEGGLEAATSFGPLAEIKRIGAENALARSESLASHGTLGSGYINAARTAVGDAAREGAQEQSSLQSQIGAEIGEMQRQYLKEKMAMQVQLAEVLAEEKYKAEQLALDRARLAAENAARAQEAAGNQTRYKGREGVYAWAAANNVPANELALILQAAARENESGPGTGYAMLRQKGSGQQTLSQMIAGWKAKPGPWKSGYVKQPAKPKSMNMDRLQTGLDIYFGNYAGYAE